MISGDLDTDEHQRPSFFRSVLRSFSHQTSRGNVASTNSSKSSTMSSTHTAPQPAVYAACLSSLCFFIHDGTVSANEADDPYNAICFFHPPNYTPTEQWEFTGPIVGAVRFMSSFANSPPKIIHLTNSSIALIYLDNYTIALKASKVLCSSSLEACLRDLYNVFSLFFNDLKFVKKLCRDDEPDVALGRFKYNLAHIWTKLIGLVGPCKLLQPIAHIPHFVFTEDSESQLYQFFSCIVAILSGFSHETFGCLLSYNSQLVQSTFNVSLTRTLMLSSSLLRNMPQTAHVLPSSSRLPNSAFVRYAFSTRSQLFESQTKLRNLLKSLPLATRSLLSKFDSSLVDSAFLPRQQLEQADSSINSRSDDGSKTPNSVILSRYFDFAWTMAGQSGATSRFQTGFESLEDSYSTTLSCAGQENRLPYQEGDLWESRSSSVSSITVNLNGVLQSPYSPIATVNNINELTRPVSFDQANPPFSKTDFDKIWADSTPKSLTQPPSKLLRRVTSDISDDPFGHFRRLAQVLRDDDEDEEEEDPHTNKPFQSDESKIFDDSLPSTSEQNAPVPGALVDTIRNAASCLADEHVSPLTQEKRETSQRTVSDPSFSATGFLDSGHSSVHFAFSDLQDSAIEAERNNSTDNLNTGRHTGDSGHHDTSSDRASSVLVGGEANEIIETCLYVQSHGPLSLIVVVPNSPSLVKVENLRKLYEVLLQILADVCSLLMHLESETAAQQSKEAVVVSYEPSRQRLHRLGLCRGCNSDIRFDSQLFAVQRLFAKDPNIRDLQISDWASHVHVTKETSPPPEEVSNLRDFMAPYRSTRAISHEQSCARHSYVKVKRNGCATSLVVLPSSE